VIIILPGGNIPPGRALKKLKATKKEVGYGKYAKGHGGVRCSGG
jgi:hypothetical protein